MDGGAGTFRAVEQEVMRRLGDIDGGADCHAMITSQTRGRRFLPLRKHPNNHITYAA